jgi:hypothetical protein
MKAVLKNKGFGLEIPCSSVSSQGELVTIRVKGDLNQNHLDLLIPFCNGSIGFFYPTKDLSIMLRGDVKLNIK